ncbi:MAG: VirB8/TrbF family protein [Bryobacterales bacterium]|nr:VirB8/TrbF family protein [Bryobacterales bacterium]
MNEKNVREYAEAWAAHASAARTLRWIVGALILVLFITSIGWVRSASHEPQPLFVRVDDVGRAEVVNYQALQFDKNPVSPVTKFFLARFIRDHYERRQGGVREAWTRSLYFLTSELAQTASASDSENIAAVIAGQSSEIVMQDLTLRITPSELPPFTAIATYTLIYQRRGTELGRELWSTELRFHFLDGVPSEYVLVNPIGLSVSYLRSDRAVSE